MKKKIVIFGTGISALSTAFELTEFPGWQELYEVTIYQVGWRAGGKTASSRGKHNRIQERGIHILQGWYRNMFRLVRRSYNERRDQNLFPDHKFKEWKDALVKDDTTLLTTETSQGSWQNWPFIFPEDELIPGDTGDIPFPVIARRVIGMICQLIFGSPYAVRHGFWSFIPKWLFSKTFKSFPIADATPTPIPQPVYGSDPKMNAQKYIDDMIPQLKNRSELPLSLFWYVILCTVIWPLSWFFSLLQFLLTPFIKRFTQLNRLFSSLEWVLITTKGALKDCYDSDKHELIFRTVNKYDYRAWLAMHGGSKRMIQCGLVKFMYYGSFANLNGKEPGILAADMAIRIVMDTILYRGSLVWKTKAGTGGTIIAPIYQVLEARGVTFKFFHRLEKIHYSETGRIEELTLVQQVKLADDREKYDPLILVNGLTDWPENPLYDQLDPVWADKLKAGNINLESPWADWTDYRSFTLKADVDFDQIVAAIPVRALKDVSADIIHHNKKWKDMVDNVPTVQTFGVQLWIKPTIAEMGFDGPSWGLRTTDEPNSVVYDNLLYSWTDMSLILAEENWPADNKPGDLAYFCGTMADASDPLPPYSDHSYPETQLNYVREITKVWLQKNMGWLFPKAAPNENPKGFDFALLVDPNNNPVRPAGDELFQLQYFSPNLAPSNRYTLAWPGTDKYRLRAAETDFSNLYFAGDWTNFGLNVGHLEGTCISGIRAAIAVLANYV